MAHKDEIDLAISSVLESGHYILGPKVSSFEEAFASYLSARFVVAVASGTDALEIALRACDIGPGDIVVSVSHTAIATISAIERCGATPLLLDINPLTYTMDPGVLEEELSSHQSNLSRIKAIIPVHLYGKSCDMTRICDIARRFGLRIIEDCAQAHGAEWEGQKVGTFGDAAAFSFYPTKNLAALGDAGAIATNDPLLAEKVRHIRQYGWDATRTSQYPGLNSRMDELQAAVLLIKLSSLQRANQRRITIARRYNRQLHKTDLLLPRQSREPFGHVYHQYVVRSPSRNRLQRFLSSYSIRTAIHYPTPAHLNPAYSGRILTGYSGLQHTESIADQILSLPIFPELSDEHIDLISERISAFFEKHT